MTNRTFSTQDIVRLVEESDDDNFLAAFAVPLKLNEDLRDEGILEETTHIIGDTMKKTTTFTSHDGNESFTSSITANTEVFKAAEEYNLRERIKEAVRKEDYEAAVKLKEQINELNR